MSDDQRLPSQSPVEARLGRSGGFGRALERLKAVLKRKSPSKSAPTTPSKVATSTSPAIASGSPLSPVVATADTEVELPTGQAGPSSSKALVTGDSLEADDSTENMFDKHEESLLPMNPGSSRTGISEEKARILFEKYGVKSAGHRPTAQEPPSKIRRVERPLRIRIHWTCHQCRKAFANRETCAECGHLKCRECIREPPRSSVDNLEHTRSGMGTDEATERTADALPFTASTLEATEDLPDEIAEPTTFLFTIQARTHGGANHVQRPRAQILGRMCHECKTPFLQSIKADCHVCGHNRCSLCPRHSPKTGKSNLGLTGLDMAQTATVLERVYRKPRQRVRWKCDQCNSIVRADKCSKCEHPRCSGCLREPSKPVKNLPDPAVLRSVQEKLAAGPSRQAWPQLVLAHS